MALSNWDTLAFDIDGPCTGSVTNHEGYTVEVYKNWLYLKAGDEYVMTVHEGRLEWGNWTIDARRGPQDGVFVVAYSSEWLSDEECAKLDVKVGRKERRFLVGCGVYGFEDRSDLHRAAIIEAGFEPHDDDLVFQVGHYDNETGQFTHELEFLPHDAAEGEKVQVIASGLPDPGWVGVSEESVAFLRAMVAEYTTDTKWVTMSSLWPGDRLKDIDWDGALRANQGDMFFAERVGVEPAGTPVGAAEKPWLLELLGGSDADQQP